MKLRKAIKILVTANEPHTTPDIVKAEGGQIKKIEITVPGDATKVSVLNSLIICIRMIHLFRLIFFLDILKPHRNFFSDHRY